MIILQLLAALLVLIMTIPLLILFNVYLLNGIYLFFVSLFILVYALVFALVLHNTAAILWVSIILVFLYGLRMSYLAFWLHSKAEFNYPALRGQIKSKNYFLHTTLFFPLSFLNVLKLLPKMASQELAKQIRQDIKLSQLIDLIFDHCRGTEIEIQNEQLRIRLEIQ